MDNLIDKLRAEANLTTSLFSKSLIAHAADTIAARSRLLALAETLAGAVRALSMPWDNTTIPTALEAAQAFNIAQVEYQATGKVPCPECERLLEKASTVGPLTRECERLYKEADDLRRQLVEAQALLADELGRRKNLGAQVEALTADNAALVEALSVIKQWNDQQKACFPEVDHCGFCQAYPNSHGGSHKERCPSSALDILSHPHPHPGAGLLAELAALRKVDEALTGHDHGHLSQWVTTLKQSDGEGWAIGEMVQRYLDAIRNRKDGE